MTNKTNYMRSVNDYSLSAHEIFNEQTANRFPAFTRVANSKNITSENFAKATEIVLDQFREIGFSIDRSYSINYDDGSEPGEESQYTIYEQLFYVLRNVTREVVVLELYRRNGELIILTLSTVDTDKQLKAARKILEADYKPPRKDKVFYTISQSSHGFDLEELKIKTNFDETLITRNYNDDFAPVHETLMKYIDEDRKGLVLLHGIPGSGKTSYIKQLISKGGVRKVVYIPPHLASSIASPAFISFVREKLRSCVLVIEDAEEILKDRAGSHDSAAVSNLLNISDGILGEALNILIICTFNLEKQFIDKALMRKGRMIAEYYFGELEKGKAAKLVKEIHGEDAELDLKSDEELTLANIFNMDFVQHRSKEAPKVAKFGFAA